MYQFKYTYSNGVEEFSRIFSLEEIEQGLQFDEILDSPLVKYTQLYYNEIKPYKPKKNLGKDLPYLIFIVACRASYIGL